MCLIAIDWKTSAGWPVVLIGNRDERHARPTSGATFWADQPCILAGRDLTAGGTWLGVHTSGRFAAVTNYREPLDPPDHARSRGALVGEFLRGTMSPVDYMQQVASNAECYAGFNLFVGDLDTLAYFCNREGLAPRALEPGRYALSNAALDTPWPKVERMRDAFSRTRDRQSRPDSDALFALLYDTAPAADSELPTTGLNRDLERRLSAPFIINDAFGTRTSTVLVIAGDGRGAFSERNFDSGGRARETRHFLFHLVQ